MDGGIGIELFYQGEQLRLARRRGKVVLNRMKPAGLRGLAFGFDIDLTCGIVADKDDREAGFSPCAASARVFFVTRAITCSEARLPSIRRAFAPDRKRTPFPAGVAPVCVCAMASS